MIDRLRARLEATNLPPLPSRIILGFVGVLTIYVLLPSSDRFGFLFGILTIAVWLSILELVRPQPWSGGWPAGPAVEEAFRDAVVTGYGLLRRTESGALERIDPASHRIETYELEGERVSMMVLPGRPPIRTP